jgi:hypothetical protein
MKKPKQRRMPTGDYPVGNCRPPMSSRFKPGHSGNPKGKVKRPASVAMQIENILQRKIIVTENGVPRETTVQESMFRSLSVKVAKGDLKAIETLFRLRQIYRDDPAEVIDPADLDAGDKMLLAAFLRDERLGIPSDPPAVEPSGSAETPDSGPDTNTERPDGASNETDGDPK